MTAERKKWLVMLGGIFISIACLAWVGFEFFKDPMLVTQAREAFQNANYAVLPVMWLALFLFYWLKAWRWRLLLSAVRPFRPLRDLFSPMMIGFAFNNVLPARIGEFVRCAVFSRQQQVSLAVSISSLVLERIFDGIAILFYLAIGLFFVQGLPDFARKGALVFSCMAVLVVLVSLCYVIWTRPIIALIEGVLKRIPFLPAALTKKVCAVLEGGAAGLATIKDPRLVTAMLAISLVKWALNWFIILLALWAFGLPATIPQGMVLMGCVAFAVSLPNAPGFWGVMQLAFVEVGKIFDSPATPFPQGTMLAASIFYHLAQYIPVTLTGLGLFVLSGLKLSQVEPASQTGSTAAANTSESAARR